VWIAVCLLPSYVRSVFEKNFLPSAAGWHRGKSRAMPSKKPTRWKIPMKDLMNVSRRANFSKLQELVSVHAATAEDCQVTAEKLPTFPLHKLQRYCCKDSKLDICFPICKTQFETLLLEWLVHHLS
jgi:hypothetical protein